MTLWETGEPVSPSIVDYGPASEHFSHVTSHPFVPRAHSACIDDAHSSCVSDWLSSTNQSLHRSPQSEDHHIPYVAPFDLT